jgi:hypothetical protein
VPQNPSHRPTQALGRAESTHRRGVTGAPRASSRPRAARVASTHGQRTRPRCGPAVQHRAAPVGVRGVLGGQPVGSAIESQERDDGAMREVRTATGMPRDARGSPPATALAWAGDPAGEAIARDVADRYAAAGPPRRLATARIDLGLIIRRGGRPDEAAALGTLAAGSGRLVPSNRCAQPSWTKRWPTGGMCPKSPTCTSTFETRAPSRAEPNTSVRTSRAPAEDDRYLGSRLGLTLRACRVIPSPGLRADTIGPVGHAPSTNSRRSPMVEAAPKTKRRAVATFLSPPRGPGALITCQEVLYSCQQCRPSVRVIQ